MKRIIQSIIGLICAGICAAAPAVAQDRALRPMGGWLKPGGTWTLRMPVRVLLTGDSLMQGLGPQMRDVLLGYKNLTMIPIGKKSTGLSRPDFYNWPRVLKEHLISDRPHLVIMWVGTNDAQGIYGMSGLGEPCSQAWMVAYHAKVREIFQLTRAYKARLILMGPPPVADPALDAKLEKINKLMLRACEIWDRKSGGVCYVNTRAILGDVRGKYMSAGNLPSGQQGTLRTHDGVHITADGYKRVMHYLLPCISAELKLCFDAHGNPVYDWKPHGAALRGGRR